MLLGTLAIVQPAASPAQAAPGDTIIYGANGYGLSQIVELNLTQQTFQQVGSVARETQAVDQDPATGFVYFYEWKTTGNEFGYWNPANGSNTIVRLYNPGPGLYMKRMAFAPDGTLYLMDANDRLFTINKTNGNITSLGQVSGLVNGQWGGTGDMAFAPDGTLYVATYRSLYTVNVATRTSKLLYSNMIGVTGVGITVWTGLAFCDGLLYASNGEQYTELSAMFSIDPATGEEHLLYYTNTLFNDLTSCPATPPAPNNAPVANGGSVATDEDASVGVTLTATDGDGDPLTYAVDSQPSHGALSGTAPNVTYTPAANWNGVDSFTFHANDGQANSNTATVTVTVNPVNDAPVAAGQSVVTSEDTSVGVTLAGSDVDGDSLSYAVDSQPSNGTLSGTAPNLTYTPDPGFNGSDSFTFHADDGLEDSNTATVAITVTEQNEVPLANDASVSTDEDVALGVTLTGTDGDGDPLTYAIDSQPSDGTLSGTAPNLTYTPDADSNGVDSFTFHANDGVESSNTATVTITVNPVNDAPVAGDQSAGTSENTPTGITLASIDVDGDPLTYVVDSQPTSGALSGTAPNLTYTPDPGTSGVDSFTFHANDGSVDSNTATVTVTVDEVNDVPVAADRSVATDEDAAIGVTLTATDGDGDPLTYAVDSQPSNGTLSGAAPNLTYTPGANWNGVDSFTFHANDGAADSNTATVTITVAPVNDAPVATGSSAATDQDVAVGVALSATDVDGDPLTYVVGSPPSNGTLSGTAPNLTYTPAPGWHGVDSFTFRANDGSVDSNTATVTITVDEVVSDLVMYAPSRTAAMTEINVTQGTVQQVPGLSFGTHAMDTDPATGLAYYFEWNTNGYRFARWDPVTRTNTTIRTYSPAPGFFATQMAFAPDGTLYMIDSSARLRTIDKVTGALTDRGAISGMANGPYGQVGDLAIAPNGTAYVATYGNLYSLNLATRATTLLQSNMFGTPTKVWLGLAFCDGTLYGSNVDGTTNRSSIYTINPATGATSVVHNLSVYVTDLTACV